MADIVYVHAYTNDDKVMNDLVRFYIELMNSDPKGMTRLNPVTNQRVLNKLISGRRNLGKAIKAYPFEGVGMWTEWDNEKYIKKFFSSEMHGRFVRYAMGTLDRAKYRVVQLVNGRIKTRDIPD